MKFAHSDTFTHEIRELIRIRNTARRIWHRYSSRFNLGDLKVTKQELYMAIKEYKADEWRRSVQGIAVKNGNVGEMVRRKRRGPSFHIPALTDQRGNVM